jgi:hypothetical protein
MAVNICVYVTWFSRYEKQRWSGWLHWRSGAQRNSRVLEPTGKHSQSEYSQLQRRAEYIALLN